MSAVRGAVKRLASAADRVRPPVAGVTILIYHRVGGGSGSEVDLDPAVFADQLAWLGEHARVLTLAEALQELALPSPGAAPAVVVTFDDGTVDFVESALPALAEASVPATLYLATRFVEEAEPFPWGALPLSWRSLADALASGLVDIGSHTHRHLLLDRLAADQIADELDRSRGLIEDRLGTEAHDFAYPKAVAPSPAADAAVRERFRSAALAGTRSNPFGGIDAFALARSPIQVADGMRWFERKARGGLWLEDALRRVVNRGRYAGATT